MPLPKPGTQWVKRVVLASDPVVALKAETPDGPVEMDLDQIQSLLIVAAAVDRAARGRAGVSVKIDVIQRLTRS